MNKDAMFSEINAKYDELKLALEGEDLDKIKTLTLELHALVHPREISGRSEETIADFVLDYMMDGNKISVKTLNLNQDFKLIEEDLDQIVNDFLKT